MDVWNIFSIERRSAFLRFRLVDDDVLSGEKRSSMVDSEDFGEEDIAPKRVPPTKERLRVAVVVQETSKQNGKRGRKERENEWRILLFFSFQTTKEVKNSLLSLQKGIVNANIYMHVNLSILSVTRTDEGRVRSPPHSYKSKLREAREAYIVSSRRATSGADV